MSTATSSDAVAALSFTSRVARMATDARDEARPPMHWPTMSSDQAARQWPELLQWVQDLRERYESFDEKTLPPCWYRHPCFVGALQALKDFERLVYAKNAPGSAPAGVDWRRALRDVELLISRWSAGAVTCVGGHKENKGGAPIDTAQFVDFVDGDLRLRRDAGT